MQGISPENKEKKKRGCGGGGGGGGGGGDIYNVPAKKWELLG